MTGGLNEKLPITSAARNAVWVYPVAVPSRFIGGKTIVENKRTHEAPNFDGLLEGADVAVELYGNAISFRLDGLARRVYTDRFEFVTFMNERDAREAFGALWSRIREQDSIEGVKAAAKEWRRLALPDKDKIAV